MKFLQREAQLLLKPQEWVVGQSEAAAKRRAGAAAAAAPNVWPIDNPKRKKTSDGRGNISEAITSWNELAGLAKKKKN